MKLFYCFTLFLLSIISYSQSISLIDKINQSENFIRQSMTEYSDYYLKRIEDGPFYYEPYTSDNMCRTFYYYNTSNSNSISFKVNTSKNKCFSIVFTEDIDSLPQLLNVFNNTANFTETNTMHYQDKDGRFKIRIETTRSSAIVYVDVLKYY